MEGEVRPADARVVAGKPAAAKDPAVDAAKARRSAAADHARAARRYLAASAGCALFAFIYAHFSHGVHSPFMTFMFTLPLIGGALPALAFRLVNARSVPLLARQAWALAIACLTVASCMRGVFDVAGTASPYLAVYLFVAAAYALAAIASLVGNRKMPHEPSAGSNAGESP